MNKTEFIKELSKVTNCTEDECVIINDGEKLCQDI